MAIERYTEAIPLGPDGAIAYHRRSTIYGRLGQYQQAVEDFDNAIQLDSDNAESYNNRGYVYHGIGQHQRAIEDCDCDMVSQLNADNA